MDADVDLAASPNDDDCLETAITALVPQPKSNLYVLASARRLHVVLRNPSWIEPDLTAHLPALAGLSTYVETHIYAKAIELPNKEAAEYPILRCFTAPSKDGLEEPLRALTLAVQARSAHWANAGDENLSEMAQVAANELAKATIGISRKDVRPKRKAFLQAAARESGNALEYAQALQRYLAAPETLPTFTSRHDAEPGETLEPLLRRSVIPILSGRVAPRPPTPEPDPLQPWELDDDPDTDLIITIPPATDADDDPFEDEVLVAIDQDLDPATRGTPQELYEEPTAVRPDQAIYSRNQHFLEYHADVLTPEEAKKLAPELLASLDEALDEKDLDAMRLLATLAIMMSTGLTRHRVAMAMHPSAGATTPGRYLSHDCNYLISTALGPRKSSAEAPQDESAKIPAQQIAIPLPPAISSRLRRLKAHFPAMAPPINEINGVYGELRKLAAKLENPAITLGRLRRLASVRLFDECHDLPAVMVICGDSFAHSVAPLHYASWPAEELQDIVRRAIWPLWKMDLEATESVPDAPPPPSGLPSSIGSQHCPELIVAKSACRLVGAGLHAGKPDPGSSTPESIAKTQNQMAAHLGALFVGVVGHRPSKSLFKLTSLDVDTELQLAIFQDKASDPAHLTRLVAMGSEVSSQCRLYLDHLRAMLSYELPEKTHQRIQRALGGKKSLLFGLDREGNPVRWELKSWRTHLPDAWVALKSNYGRHVIATLGRSSNFDPEWIAIQMGHYDLVGHPFSPDSPTYPTRLAEKIGPLLDEIYKVHGWRKRKGLSNGLSPDSDNVWGCIGPLKIGSKEAREHQSLIAGIQKKFRDHFFASTRGLRHTAEVTLLDHLWESHQPLALALTDRFNLFRQRRNEQVIQPAGREPVRPSSESVPLIKKEEWLPILEKLEENLAGKRPLYIAVRNRLAVGLKSLNRSRKYKGFIPPGFRYRALPDASPFPAAIFRASRQVRALRAHFRSLELSPAEASGVTAQCWALGKTALALVIYGQVTDARILTALLFGAESSLGRMPASPDSLLVHLKDPATTVALHRVAALAFAKWRLENGIKLLPDDPQSEIESALQVVLPSAAFKGKRALKALLATMDLMVRIEQSGYERYCLDTDAGSVSLSPTRCQEYLGLSDPFSSAKPIGRLPSNVIHRKAHTSDIIKALNQLTAAIPEKDGDLELPRTQQTVRIEVRRYKQARDAVTAELENWIDDPDTPDIVCYAASWLRYTCTRPKRTGTGLLEWTSIKDYFGLVKKALSKGIGTFELNEETDTEDLEALYLDALGTEKEGSCGLMAVQLLDFHSHLESAFAFDAVDRSLFLPYLAKLDRDSVGSVSNDLILPEESALIRQLMLQSTVPSSQHQLGKDVRLLTQARFVQCLLQVSGARIAEICGITHRDVILLKDAVVLILRANGYRGEKTTSARRMIGLPHSLDSSVEDFSAWVRNDRKLLSNKQLRKAFVFRHLQSHKPIGRVILSRLVREAIHLINNQLWPHKYRHFHVTEEVSVLKLGVSPRIFAEPGHADLKRDLLPRDLAEKSCFVGHRRPRTGGRCYMHLPAVNSICSQFMHTGQRNFAAEAAAWGIAENGMMRQRQRYGDQYISRMLNRVARLPSSAAKPERALDDVTMSARDKAPRYCQALDLLCAGRPKVVVQQALGLEEADIQSIVLAARTYTQENRIHLLPENDGKKIHYPRWRGRSKELQYLWEKVEIGQEPDALELIEMIRLAVRRKGGIGLMWSRRLADLIHRYAPGDKQLEARVLDGDPGSRMRIWLDDVDVTREYVWCCAVASTIYGLMHSYQTLTVNGIASS